MSMKKKLAAVLAAALSVSVSASAQISIDELSAEFSADRISVAGSVGDADSDVLITVYKRGATKENFEELLGWQNMVGTDGEGKYKDEFKMSGAGIYTIIAATADESEKLDFTYTDSASAKAAIEGLNSAADRAAYLEENKTELALLFPGIDEEPRWTSAADFAEKLLPLSSTDIDKSIKELQRSVMLAYVSDGKVNAFDYADLLGIYEAENNEVFKEKFFTEAHKREASAKVADRGINDYDDFCRKITEAMILAAVKKPDGSGNVKKVLETHSDFIGINTSNTPDGVYRNLAGRSFNSIEALKAAYNEQKNGTNSGGGSGGSGGGGGGGRTLDVRYDPIESAGQPTAVRIEDIFTDLSGFDWAKEAIRSLYGQKIIQGKAEGLFAPQDNVTRAEFVKMLTGALEIADAEGEISFTDVSENDWSYPYIKKAYLAGIVKGVDDTTFNGGAYISRQDMAVMICRAIGANGSEASAAGGKFEDDAMIARYSKEYVYTLKAKGILSGDENGRFNPANYANRAEAAKVIYLTAK